VHTASAASSVQPPIIANANLAVRLAYLQDLAMALKRDATWLLIALLVGVLVLPLLVYFTGTMVLGPYAKAGRARSWPATSAISRACAGSPGRSLSVPWSSPSSGERPQGPMNGGWAASRSRRILRLRNALLTMPVTP
jgi:hypothetical protein